MTFHYEDTISNMFSQIGAFMTSWLGDQTEKVTGSIPYQGKDTVKILRWLLIPFLRYIEHKIHTKINVCLSSRFDPLGFP